MREYRLHFYSAEGKFQRVEAIHAPDHRAALERARIRHHPHRVDVLCGAEKIGSVTPGGS